MYIILTYIISTEIIRRFDWYQTETTIVITLLVKNVKAEHLSVDAEAKLVGGVTVDC